MKQISLISYHLDGVTAGPSIRFQRYAPLFIEKGYRITFVTRMYDSTLPKRESRKDYDVLRIKSNTKYLKHTLFIFKAIWAVCMARNKPDALLTFTCNSFQLWIFPFLKIRNIKLIYISTMDFNTLYKSGENLFTLMYNRLHFSLYRLLYLNLHAIVTSSAKLAESFKPFNLPAGKVVYIHNGVNLERFYPVNQFEKQLIRRDLGIPEEGRIVLYVGLKTERKGLLDLYETWQLYHKKFPLDYLLLIGNEKREVNLPDFNQRWEAIKQRIQVDNSIRILLIDNVDNVEKYFQSADLFIFLSYKEGMPNVLLEAMASGLPIITTAFQGFSNDYGIPGEHIVLVERTPSIIATQIETVLNDAKFCQLLASNALNKIKEDGALTKSVGFYLKLISGK